MKRSKKLVCMLLAAVLVFALSITAAAEGATYTITINNTTDGHTYGAYQIFAGDLAGKVLSNIQWGAGITTVGQEALKMHYSLTSEATAADVAKKLGETKDVEAFAEIAGAAGNLGKATATSNDTGAAYTIAGLAAGYYLVKDTTDITGHDSVTRYIIEVVEDSTVTPKTTLPTVEKKVKDADDTAGTTTDWQDSADYDIGDAVPFQLTATMGAAMKENYKTYKVVFYDTLSAGLTYNADSLKVKVDSNELQSTDYTVAAENNELTVTIADVIALGAANNSKIVVEYTATLNEKAVIGAKGNPNTVFLEFSNNPNGDGTGTTPEDKVTVFTYQLDVNKVDGEKNPLKGAGFTLYKEDKVNGYVAVGNEVKGTDLTTFTWKGLDDGKYKLVESTTPAGYNTIKDIEFTITAKHEVKSADPTLTSLTVSDASFKVADDKSAVSAEIVNNAGSTLPETGGMGTTLFYVLGGILAVGAVVLLVTKKRMSAKKDV